MKYYLPTRWISGPNAVVENAELIAAFGSRCMLVTSGTAARRCGALQDVISVLESKNIVYTLYDSVRPNPSIASCVEGGRLANAFGAQFILGIGGGSPLDAAKIIAVSAANPELDSKGLYSLNWENVPLPTVLVGTTAGTGSEVTPVAVITNDEGMKKSFHSDLIYASLAFGDPRYTASMPLAVTASTGVDALCHCVESYFAKTETVISRGFALQGIRMLLSPLRDVAAGLIPTAEQREILYNGSILGGMAISITGTIMPHNMGYYLTEHYGVPHGFACAAFHPALLHHAQQADPACCKEFAREIGISLQELSDLVASLVPDLGIRMTEEEIHSILPRWENNKSIRNTIGELTLEKVQAILTEEFMKG